MSASGLVEPLHQLEQRLRRQFVVGVHDANEFTGSDPKASAYVGAPAPPDANARFVRQRRIEIAALQRDDRPRGTARHNSQRSYD